MEIGLGKVHLQAMKTLLTIDLGNTRPTVGLFINHKMRALLSWKQGQRWVGQYPFILSSVQGESPSTLKSHKSCMALKSFWKGNHFVEMPVQYAKTLGEDRLVQGAYLFHSERKKHLSEGLLLIDAGTFITVDHISSQGFLGGYILPGWQIFLDTYLKGKQLPLIEKENFPSNFLACEKQGFPQTTEEAITHSVCQFYQLFFRDLLTRFSFGKIIFTGGDGLFLKEKLMGLPGFSSPICVVPHLIHHSLHFLARRTS